MLDIDITDFVNTNEPFDFSASAAERGVHAGPTTWANAMREAAASPLLTTEEQLQALRDHVRGFGAWDDATIDGWTADECNALFIQLVSGDMREAGMDEVFIDEFDWDAYRARAEAGQIQGNISPCDIEGHPAYGRIFYTLSE